MSTTDQTPEADPLLLPAEVTPILRVKVSTLASWRAAGLGPEWFRSGRKTVVYRRSAIYAWLAAQERASREQQEREHRRAAS